MRAPLLVILATCSSCLPQGNQDAPGTWWLQGPGAQGAGSSSGSREPSSSSASGLSSSLVGATSADTPSSSDGTCDPTAGLTPERLTARAYFEGNILALQAVQQCFNCHNGGMASSNGINFTTSVSVCGEPDIYASMLAYHPADGGPSFTLVCGAGGLMAAAEAAHPGLLQTSLTGATLSRIVRWLALENAAAASEGGQSCGDAGIPDAG